MQELLRTWDGEGVVIRYDRQTDAWIFLAIHDRTLGMAAGGCRFKTYLEPREGLADALRLARGMTYKWAAVEFPFGGGKTVVAAPGVLDPAARTGLLHRVGDIIDMLAGAYGTGIDLGTTPADMDTIAERTRWVFGRSPERGGSGDPGPWTALGVHVAMEAACEAAFGTDDLSGRSVLVQGVGSVGAALTRRLAGAGARLLVSDAIPARAEAVAAACDGVVVPPEAVYDTPCDVFAPCAIGGILNERSVPRLACRVVCGSANNQLETDADADRLHRRGILYAPDFVANAGGAIAHGSLEVHGASPEETGRRIRRVRDTLAEILRAAAERDESPLHESVRRAERVLERARRGRAAAAEPLEVGG
jgi:leucine dehydrogenase